MLTNKKHIHFVGIGGSGMNPLARILIDMGFTVSGSDIKENVYTLRLKEMGATIFYGHNESHIRLAQLIVISSAIKEDNVEYAAALRNRIPVIKRAELLSYIMDKHHIRIAVAGTHGKTTVSSFLSHYLNTIGKHPTFVIGAPMKQSTSGSQYGNPEYIIAEADESDRSFLFLNPNVIVITNIEEEHMDQFRDLNDILKTYQGFISRMSPDDSLLIIHGDDPNISKLDLSSYKVIRYGFGKHNDIQARHIKAGNNRLEFDVFIQDKCVAQKISLQTPGEQNILNCLTVFSLVNYYKLPLQDISRSFQSFEGASRRFHQVGSIGNIDIYDDYAHHPTEIRCTLKSAKIYNKRVIALFQPHRYSRFSYFVKEFADALNEADFTIITDIYAAGEKNVQKVSAMDLLSYLPEDKTLYVKHIGDLGRACIGMVKPNDLIITLGAGDITHVSKEIYQLLKANIKK